MEKAKHAPGKSVQVFRVWKISTHLFWLSQSAPQEVLGGGGDKAGKKKRGATGCGTGDWNLFKFCSRQSIELREQTETQASSSTQHDVTQWALVIKWHSHSCNTLQHFERSPHLIWLQLKRPREQKQAINGNKKKTHYTIGLIHKFTNTLYMMTVKATQR